MIVLGYSGFSSGSRRAGGRPLSRTNLTFDNLFRFRDGDAPLALFPLGFFGHDPSAAVVVDGEVVACAAEERFTRVKHGLNLAGASMLPGHAVAWCLERAGVGVRDVDAVAHYCHFTAESVGERLALLRPFLDAETAERLSDSYSAAHASVLGRDAVLSQFERMTGRRPRRFVPVRHHLAHAASAYFASGFDESLVLTLDGSGETESSAVFAGRGAALSELGRAELPTSLGALYLIVTVYLGFRSLGDEYKVMGLASYGDPARYRGFFDDVVACGAHGSYATPRLADPELRERMVHALGASRAPGDPVGQRHADVAAALQEALERAVLRALADARAQTGLTRLCMAGGVALNCTLNGKIARAGLFDEVFVQPAAGDDGAGLGAALWTYHDAEHAAPQGARWRHASLGPEFTDDDIGAALDRFAGRVRFRREPDIAGAAARETARGAVVGWFQGRMEFGPRALGNRSILADPRDPSMKDRLNSVVKRREPFRPFAPAVLEEFAGAYFDLTGVVSSPFMLFAVPVRPERRAEIPAVTHVDGSARVQTVSRASNPLFWEMIDRFRGETGVPVVLNTSFNVGTKPIVCTPADALECFLGTGIDALAIGSFLVEKERAP